MAKVKSPLFGFDASGQLAKTLVYMKWKGINDVRQHVIPANPNTEAQQAQRALIRAAVLLWHGTAWTPADLTAWNRYAGVKPRPMSGYNVFTSDYITAVLDEKTFNALYDFIATSTVAGRLTVSANGPASLTTVKVRYGTSKTAMFNVGTLIEEPAGTYLYAIDDLVEGAKYYSQIYVDYALNAGNTGIGEQLIMST
jgi:hypothetical protein